MKRKTAAQSLGLESGASPRLGEVLGSYDAPAFARRGRELESSLLRFHARCEAERLARLDGVRMRLKQWASAAEGPEEWRPIFAQPIDALWPLTGAEPPPWCLNSGPGRPSPKKSRRRSLAAAKTLLASILRFNRSWEHYLNQLNLDPLNLLIEHYNTYYVFEKECLLRSAILAERHFRPVDRLSVEGLLHDHPPLPVPALLPLS